MGGKTPSQQLYGSGLAFGMTWVHYVQKNGWIFWGLGAVNHPQMASFGRCRMGGFGWEVVVTHENVLQFGWYML